MEVFPGYPPFSPKKVGSGTIRLKLLYRTVERFQKTWKKTVKRETGLLVYKSADKSKGTIKRVPDGKKVKVMYTKSWYAKVLLVDGSAGYMKKKYLK